MAAVRLRGRRVERPPRRAGVPELRRAAGVGYFVVVKGATPYATHCLVLDTPYLPRSVETTRDAVEAPQDERGRERGVVDVARLADHFVLGEHAVERVAHDAEGVRLAVGIRREEPVEITWRIRAGCLNHYKVTGKYRSPYYRATNRGGVCHHGQSSWLDASAGARDRPRRPPTSSSTLVPAFFGMCKKWMGTSSNPPRSTLVAFGALRRNHE